MQESDLHGRGHALAQHLELTHKCIAQNSVRVIVSSVEWTEGRHFQESVHFAVETDGL